MLCDLHLTSFGELIASVIYQATKLFWPDCLLSSLSIRFKRKRTREETTHRPPDHVHLSTEVTDEVASESSAACLSSDDCRMEPGSGPFTGKNF